MIKKRDIQRSLQTLDRRYNAATLDIADTIYYSKLAVLEYCGWIEHCMDQIVERSIKGKLKTDKFKRKFQKEIVGRTYGFMYDKHFLPMVIRTVGIVEAERLERLLEADGSYQVLEAQLNQMKKYRDKAAHTWSDLSGAVFPAPSMLLGNLDAAYPIFTKLYSFACRI
ncbi:hypothetical protein CWI76_09275 [Pseudidiomarina marina]|uniref:RiboL-PSP-HEPN domain-containing protein n=2 Tax=Pseudidiomarina marina TaxID=502366 RepID=A0A432YDZ8_9GAMM|nr:hypothetical protein CWI76_09275 [Pseudidiomarina marina]